MKHNLERIKSFFVRLFGKAKDFVCGIPEMIRDPKRRYKVYIAAGAVLIFCSIAALVVILINYQRARAKYDSIEVEYTYKVVSMPEKTEHEPEPEPDPEPEPEELPLTPEVLNKKWGELTGTDFLSFKADWPEAVGWIYFETQDINYPIMYSGDNVKYLDTAYDGTYLFAGAIFLDEESTTDFSDPHSLIYGHNMADESMFGSLRNYLYTPDYYEDRQYFDIFTGEKILRYRIFAYGLIPANSLIYWTFGPNPENMQALVDTIISESRIKPEDIEVTADDTIVTLSTCSGDSSTRTVVCAVLVGENELPEELFQ